MKVSVEDFFRPVEFQEGLKAEDYEKVYPYMHFAKSLSEITYQSIYLVDYFKRRFLYVADNPLFLCGSTAEDVLKEGYTFYLKHVPENDLELLLKINEAGFYFFKNIDREDRLKYAISYDFHLKQPNGSLMLINHKLKPVLLDQNFNAWIALCIVSLSSKAESGNIRFRSKELNKLFQFNLKKDEWQEIKNVTLNDREKTILLLSAQGATIKLIADKLFLSVDTIKFHKRNIFSKLNVKSISEAIATAIDLAVI